MTADTRQQSLLPDSKARDSWCYVHYRTTFRASGRIHPLDLGDVARRIIYRDGVLKREGTLGHGLARCVDQRATYMKCDRAIGVDHGDDVDTAMGGEGRWRGACPR